MDKYQTLEHYFGYHTFREGQEELIDRILSGSDVLGVMPTGAGKSLCYQIPALMMEGITLVVSPLISLMKDQVSALVQSGVSAAFVNSTLTARQSELALYRASNGIYQIIYVAPERLTAPSFLAFARQADIAMVVVDEAHCVSQWGQNFRPSYLQIAEFVNALPSRPVMAAFTATATDRVKRDIISLLGLRAPQVTLTGFDRPNLYFEVSKPKDKFAALASFLSLHREKSGIVYCATRKLVEEVFDRLTEEGYNAGKYHAGMPDGERGQMQERFIRDECTVMVATNAFGMGIDKSNVSYVVHYNMPKNMESYYQEAGRAGRDGEPAECILLYSGSDVRLNTFLIEKSFEDNDAFDEATAETLKNNELELLKQMTFYSTTKDCLRRRILRYFGERPAFENCGSCSNCTRPHTDFSTRDVTLEAQKILSCVKRMKESQSKWVIIDILRGTRNNRVSLCGGDQQSTFGIMKEFTSRQIEKMIDSMTGDRYLIEAPDGILRWGSAARGVIYSGMRVIVKESAADSGSRAIRSEAQIGLNADPELLSRLMQLRRKVAQMNGVPAFVIFSDATLRDMAEKKPSNEAGLRSVYGVGPVKTAKFGRQFLDEIEAYCQDKGIESAADRPTKKESKASRSRLGSEVRIREKAPNQPEIHLQRDRDGQYLFPEGVDVALFEQLRALRSDLASDYGMQSASLASIDALAQIARDKPLTLAKLNAMGLLPPLVTAYCGGEFVRTIRRFCSERGIAVNEESDCPQHTDPELLRKLTELRESIHARIYTPVSRIISDAALRAMSEQKPVTRSQLEERIHLSRAKCLIYGQPFVEAVRRYVGETQQPDGFEGAPYVNSELFVALAEMRHRYAVKENKIDTSILSDQTLYDICVRMPRNEEDFRAVYGIGAFKAQKLTGEVLPLVRQYAKGE